MDNRLIVAPLLDLEQAEGLVSAQDVDKALQFASLSRRREFLSWRAMLYKALGEVVEIEYDNGAPYIVGRDLHIGVSHTTDMVAVALADRPCAVDVERADRDVARISDRFLTESERALCHRQSDYVALWCAKECYYKLCRNKSLSLLTDIRVVALDWGAGVVDVADSLGGCERLNFERRDEHFIVYFL